MALQDKINKFTREVIELLKVRTRLITGKTKIANIEFHDDIIENITYRSCRMNIDMYINGVEICSGSYPFMGEKTCANPRIAFVKQLDEVRSKAIVDLIENHTIEDIIFKYVNNEKTKAMERSPLSPREEIDIWL